MATREPVRVLDPHRLALRLFYVDVAALGLLVVTAIYLLSDIYFLGRAAQYGGDLLAKNTGVLLRVPFAGGVFALSLGWIAYRVLGNGYRSITRAV